MPQASLSASLNYQTLGATINTDIVAIGSYLAQSGGTVDVPSGAASGATFAIPFGGVDRPIGYYLKSSVGTTTILKEAGGPTGIPLTDGGVKVFMNTKLTTVSPLGALAIQLVNTQTATGTIDYVIFGD